jgi:cyclopropane fatty-acyl-phospholipid synthase-like methyltransferase
MTRRTVPESEPHAHRASGIVEVLTALSMTVGRGNRARAVAEMANIATGDRVLDIGCGPGAAARLAARQGAADAQSGTALSALRSSRACRLSTLTVKRPSEIGAPVLG